MGWVQAFTDELATLKREGRDFDAAWQIALKRWPAEPRELGVRGRRETLFDLDRDDTALRWFQQRCRDAWVNAPAQDGSRSRLYLLPGLMAVLGRDDSASASRRRHAA